MICQPVVSSAELGQPMKLDGAIQAAQEVLAEVQRLHNSTIEVSVQEKKTQKKNCFDRFSCREQYRDLCHLVQLQLTDTFQP